MPDLILLNGPPASGKSTIARALVARRPLALDLDVDVVRGLLGGWLDQPMEAGRVARRLALAMASRHLAAGHHVVVPQFLAREPFIVELAALADDEGARFVEIALMLPRAVALDAFARRSADPASQEHADAAALQDRSGGPAALANAYDMYVALVASRPSATRVDVVLGDVDGTVDLVESIVHGGPAR